MEEKDIQVIKGAVSEALAPVAKEVKDVSTKVSTIEKDTNDLKARLEKIERTPLVKESINVNTISDTFKGYKLSKQLGRFRDMAAKDAHTFEVFGNEEKANEYAKFMIAFIKARVHNDADAKAYLSEFYQKANLAEGATATGGALVPDQYVWEMCMLARNATFALRECSILPMSTDQMYVPAELTLASVAWTTPETGQMTAGEPTFAQVSLAAKRLDGIATITNELLNDSAVDIVSILSEQFGYAVAYELDNQVLSGTGTPVSGLTTAACGYSVVMASGSTNFSAVTANHFSEAIYTLTSGDLANARFIINRIGLHYARVLKDSNGQYIFAQPGAGVPGTIWEYPYFMSEKITNTTAVSTALAVFGNFKKYYIGRRLAAGSLDVDPYGKFDYYQTRFRIVSRWALAVGRSTAFVRVMTAAS